MEDPRGGGLTRVELERSRQGIRTAEGRRVDEEVKVVRDASDDLDTLVHDVAERVLNIVAADMVNGSWLGFALLIDERETGEKRKLDRVELRIHEDGDGFSFEREREHLIAIALKGVGEMVTKVVALIGAVEKRDATMVTVLTSLGEAVVQRDNQDGKWAYKRAKMDHELDMEKVRLQAGTARTFATKMMFADLLTKYEPTFNLLAQVHAHKQGVRGGKKATPPPKPTNEEVTSVFADAAELGIEQHVLDDLREQALAMVAAKTLAELHEHQGQLNSRIVMLAVKQPAEFRAWEAAACSKLGIERAKQVIGWFKVPSL